MKIYLVTAEHFRDAGLIQRAFAGADAANAEAADLVNLMRKDSGWDCRTMARPTSWEVYLLELQDLHGTAHCFVEIAEIEVAGADTTSFDAMRYRLAEAVNEWPQYDVDDTLLAPGCIPDDEISSEVNGGDLVEWFGEWRGRVKELLAATA